MNGIFEGIITQIWHYASHTRADQSSVPCIAMNVRGMCGGSVYLIRHIKIYRTNRAMKQGDHIYVWPGYVIHEAPERPECNFALPMLTVDEYGDLKPALHYIEEDCPE